MDWWSDPSDTRWWGSLLASCAVSALVTWFALIYARHRNLLDLPGQRRSHSIPTPRGGGVGIVVAALIFFCGLFVLSPQRTDRVFAAAIATGLFLVALIGWIDDHRPLSARVRIIVHFAAALIWLLVPLLVEILSIPAYFTASDSMASWFLVGVVAVVIVAVITVWSINLHNFMDGIDGLLACQAIFVFVALGALTRFPQHALQVWILAAATLGFLPFNFPRARIFMGDVGSGALGFLIVVAIGITVRSISPPVCALLICSGFVTDATGTLLSRMLRGKRWYSAHREHLYQWLVRSGMSHVRVVVLYMAWNLLIVAPVLWWLNRGPPAWRQWMAGDSTTINVSVAHVGLGSISDMAALRQPGYGGTLETILVFALAISLWIFGKRWCLYKVKSRRHRYAAA